VPLLTPRFLVEGLRGIESALHTTEYALLIRAIERRADRDRVLRDHDVRRRGRRPAARAQPDTGVGQAHLPRLPCRSTRQLSDAPSNRAV
jgi:hypothetical protein